MLGASVLVVALGWFATSSSQTYCVVTDLGVATEEEITIVPAFLRLERRKNILGTRDRIYRSGPDCSDGEQIFVEADKLNHCLDGQQDDFLACPYPVNLDESEAIPDSLPGSN